MMSVGPQRVTDTGDRDSITRKPEIAQLEVPVWEINIAAAPAKAPLGLLILTGHNAAEITQLSPMINLAPETCC